MIYVTGDIHGEVDIHKLSAKYLRKKNIQLTKDDYLIICGDFGLIWYNENHPSYKADQYWIKWLSNKPWTTLFVDGNHENHNLLNSYPVEDWNGGKVHKITNKVIHLMRGQIFNIEGKTFLTMGGAVSQDKNCRKENKTWWANEIPTEEEWKTCFDNLTQYNNQVDYIITHCAPFSALEDLVGKNILYFSQPDPQTSLFSFIKNITSYKHWYFGHYHEDRTIDLKHTCLYHQILPLGSIFVDNKKILM